MDFDIEKYAHCFATAPNEAFFWHGTTTISDFTNRSGKYEGGENANRIAEEHHGKTVIMCVLEHRDELEKGGVIFRDIPDYFDKNVTSYTEIDYMGTEEELNRFWQLCSESFTKQASGDIRVIEGTDPRMVKGEIFKWRERKVPESKYKNSIWVKIERPILTAKDNEKVHRIISHDAVIGKEQGIIFERKILKSSERQYQKIGSDKQELIKLTPKIDDLKEMGQIERDNAEARKIDRLIKKLERDKEYLADLQEKIDDLHKQRLETTDIKQLDNKIESLEKSLGQAIKQIDQEIIEVDRISKSRDITEKPKDPMKTIEQEKVQMRERNKEISRER